MRKRTTLQAFGLAASLLMFGCGKQMSKPINDTGKADVPGSTLKTQSVTTECVNTHTITVGASYVLNNNIWGAGTNGAGSQCVWYDNSSQSWGCNASHTSGTGQNIKGYPALVRGWLWFNSSGSIWASPSDTSFPVQMSHLSSFRSNWSMTVPTNGEKYNSSYDIWLDVSNNPAYKAKKEVMIWLNYKGPAYNGSDFVPVGGIPIHTNISIAGSTWNIYEGNNGTNDVYTFRRTTNTSSVSNLDIKAFLTYAQNDDFFSSSYYLLGVQAGWEIVAGGAFTTNSYTSTIVKN
ncbi:hypothetical protein [Mucilaginibacter sp. SG564]|uniref:GH12 family glycosyl hydrolase domain-containing protein n=1 Tax=unclassified Mucilaginibacter TaxID=2617802 RepID=UPI001554C68A|nr:hypothetical protein [Mucilaginibacter sp. SG564]NOW93367.1 cellulose 1,4-beta-cellobiosidase [Mucilaginibacter sp. SG564]